MNQLLPTINLNIPLSTLRVGDKIEIMNGNINHYVRDGSIIVSLPKPPSTVMKVKPHRVLWSGKKSPPILVDLSNPNIAIKMMYGLRWYNHRGDIDRLLRKAQKMEEELDHLRWFLSGCLVNGVTIPPSVIDSTIRQIKTLASLTYQVQSAWREYNQAVDSANPLYTSRNPNEWDSDNWRDYL